jgi:hypothetical protein
VRPRPFPPLTLATPVALLAAGAHGFLPLALVVLVLVDRLLPLVCSALMSRLRQ